MSRKANDDAFIILCDKINREDIAAGRSEDFSFGRIDTLMEEDPAKSWSYEKWARFCQQVGRDVDEVLKGVTFQRAVNEAVKAAIGSRV